MRCPGELIVVCARGKNTLVVSVSSAERGCVTVFRGSRTFSGINIIDIMGLF